MATKTVILHAGEQIVLPVGTTITSIITTGSISVSSTCGNVPAPSEQVCYKMEWSVSEPSNATLDEGEGAIQYIKIGGTQYDINLTSVDSGLSTAFQNISDQLPGIFDLVSVSYADLANRKDFTMLFRSIPDVAEDIELWMTGDGFPTNGLFIKPFESEDCEEEEA